MWCAELYAVCCAFVCVVLLSVCVCRVCHVCQLTRTLPPETCAVSFLFWLFITQLQFWRLSIFYAVKQLQFSTRVGFSIRIYTRGGGDKNEQYTGIRAMYSLKHLFTVSIGVQVCCQQPLGIFS